MSREIKLTTHSADCESIVGGEMKSKQMKYEEAVERNLRSAARYNSVRGYTMKRACIHLGIRELDGAFIGGRYFDEVYSLINKP